MDYLTQRDSLFNLVTDIGNNNLAQRERTDSLAEARRARFTIGLSRDIGSRGKLGIFYRYGLTSSRESNKTSLESVTQSFEQVKTTGQASEIGMRLRGSFTRRLFYGTEGNLLFGSRKDTVTQSGITESRERSRTTRATLGFGLGYAWRPRAVLSFDVTGGFARARNARRDAATGNLSETERQRAAFLSWHAAIQADIWRQLFVSGSILSVNQWRVNDLTMFSNQPTPANNFALNTRSNVHLNSYFSNVGIGWRFASNFLAEYILTTDFGGASPRHTLLIRYNFNFTGKR